MTTRQLNAAYWVLIAVATWLYFMSRRGSYAAVALICVLSVGAIVVGVRRFQPRRAGPWYMLGAALVLSASGRLLYEALPGQGGTIKQYSWTILVLHLAMLVLLVAGLLRLARSSVRGVPAVIDAAVIVLGTGIVAAMLVGIPYARAPGVDSFWAGVRIAYVLRDVIFLAVALLFVAAVRWSASVFWVFLSFAGLLSYDVLFRLGILRGVYLGGSPIEVGWLLSFAAMGAAALVPSMATVDAPRLRMGYDVTPIRLAPVALAALLPAAVLIAEPIGLPGWYEPLIVAISTAVVILVFGRVIDAALRLRRQVAGERTLRGAITDLVDAQDSSAVERALERAVGRFLPSGTDYQILFTHLDGFDHVAGMVTTQPTATLPPAAVEQLGGRGQTMLIPLAQRSPTASRSRMTDAVDPASSSDRPYDPLILLVRSDLVSLGVLRPRLEVLVTEAAHALERIRLTQEVIHHSNEAYFRTLVHNSTDVILILDDENRIRYASPSATDVLGSGTLQGIHLPALVDSAERFAAERLLEHARAGASRTVTASSSWPQSLRGDWTLRRVAGRCTLVEVSCRDLRQDPSVGGLVVTLRDVTEQRRLEQELTERAFRDPLTGLNNRLAFGERLDAAVRDSDACTGIVAALFVDLDDLKVINDGLGHDVGDALLTRMGERLRAFAAERAATQSSLAARLGGDEFAVLLTEVTDEQVADEAASELVTTLSRPVNINGTEVICTASVGVATTAEDVDSSAELLRHADLALYTAKAAGKGQSSHYQPWMRSAVMDRLELRSALEQAISDDALFLEYQPILALAEGHTVGFEALLRWRHPLRGRLTPETFISVAEESGLIAPIGEWVIATAVEALQHWTEEPGQSLYIAVNVSARQFRHPGFVPTVRQVLARSGLAPHRLLLEITESLLLRDDETVWQDLQQLRHLGVRIAIDDFGTGYSALSYLRQVPLDIVKLDRLFIQHMTVSVQQRQLVEGIVGLTERLGLQVVAEGIETEHELALARQVGCEYGQGYLFGAPLPDEGVRNWLTAQPALTA